MNSISIIEFLLVSAIVVIQTKLALKTYNQIKVLGIIIPDFNFFKIRKFNIPIDDLQNIAPATILQNLEDKEIIDKENQFDYYNAETNVFFAGIPNKDGSFDESKVTKKYDPRISFYRILVINEEGTKGQIEFLNNSRKFQIVSNYRQSILFPLCEIVGVFDENANYFKNISYGTINKINDKWILETKIVIETEWNLYNKKTGANEIILINPNERTNPVFNEILLAINVYLLRNKGAVADFNLVKDVVERNLEMEEEEISHTVTVPLYLGLMGTMVGIVFGLLNLFLVSDSNADFDIKGFLGGVSIAMFASLWGLFCTVANSSFNLKNARRNLERAKNLFYTFLQTELLPVLNQSVSSSIYTLQTNLVKFNDNFTINLNNLGDMLNKNHDALIAQERILTALDSIDIAEFAKANIKVLKELKMGTEQLEKFGEYLNSLNHLSAKTSGLSTSFESLLNRTNNFQHLAEKIDSRVEESNNLISYLSDHYKHFEFREDVIKEMIQKVDDTMIKSLNLLEEHTQIKIDAIKQITEKEEVLLIQSFAEKSSQLSKLSLLDDLKKSVNEIKMSSAGQIGSIKEEVKGVKSSIENLNILLEEISNNNIINKTQNVAKSIKQFFISKK